MGSPVHYRHYAYDAGHLRSSRARLSNLNLNSTLLTSRELLDHFYLGAFLVLLVCVTFNPVPPANILFSFHYVQHECYDGLD